MQAEPPRGFNSPLYLCPVPPRACLVPVGFIHAGALAGIFAAALAPYLQWGLAGMVLVHLALSVRRLYGRAAARVVLTARDDWFLIEPGGRSRAVKPDAGLVLHPGLILLIFRDEQANRWPFLFWSRYADADSLRRLRVRLRYPLAGPPRFQPSSRP